MALEKNSPKGHLAKAGFYLTYRYVLTDKDGTYIKGKETDKIQSLFGKYVVAI